MAYRLAAGDPAQAESLMVDARVSFHQWKLAPAAVADNHYATACLCLRLGLPQAALHPSQV